MKKLNVYVVDKERHDFYRNIAAGMSAISFSMLVMSIEECNKSSVIILFWKCLVSASIAILIISFISEFQISQKDEISIKSHEYSSKVFSLGVVLSLFSYLFFLANISGFVLASFIVGLAVGGYYLYRSRVLD